MTPPVAVVFYTVIQKITSIKAKYMATEIEISDIFECRDLIFLYESTEERYRFPTVSEFLEQGLDFYLGICADSYFFGILRRVFGDLTPMETATALCGRIYDGGEAIYLPTSDLASPTTVYLYDILSAKSITAKRYKTFPANYCYGGFYVKNLAAKKPRITFLDGAIVDSYSGLMWKDFCPDVSSDKKLLKYGYPFCSYDEAAILASKCRTLGFCDWRIPTKAESIAFRYPFLSILYRGFIVAGLLDVFAEAFLDMWIVPFSSLEKSSWRFLLSGGCVFDGVDFEPFCEEWANSVDKIIEANFLKNKITDAHRDERYRSAIFVREVCVKELPDIFGV